MRLDCIENEKGEWIIRDCEDLHGLILAKAQNPEMAWSLAAIFLADRINKIRVLLLAER